MIFQLALRNLARNKKNTLIVGLLIAVITALFFIGNSVLHQSNEGLRKTYVQNMTGEIVIQKESDVNMSLFGANTPIIDEFFTIPTLPSYQDVIEVVRETSGVGGVTSQVSGSAVMDVLGKRSKVPLIGLDPDTYFSLFPGIQLEEGSLLHSGERGVMLTRRRVRNLEESSGKKLEIGKPIKFTVSGDTGFRIREAPLRGIFSYKNPGNFMDDVVLCDPQTVRSLNEILLATGSDYEPSEEASDSMTDDVDSLFDNAGSDTEAKGESENTSEEGTGMGLLDELNEEDSDENFAENEKPQKVEWRGGGWNFIIIRSTEDASPGAVQSRLNERLLDYKVKAVGWRTAAGNAALLVLLVQVLFNMGFVLVAIAGIIGIVNILLIAVFRRTREIGTLRAIGASDGYIRTLVLSENLLITLLSGIGGIIAGALVLQGINSAEIAVSNQLIVSLLGQKLVHIAFSQITAVTALFTALGLGIIASLYPVQKAIKIDPIVAVQEG